MSHEPARWTRIEGVFHAVADIDDATEREARLAELCAGDETLGHEVATLLAAEARAVADGAVADPHIGLLLGHYRIDGLIARGGMAAVYAASRADDAFEQRVAIKIMDLRLSDEALVAQFRAERQILAALEHPSLTRLLDGGVTPLGEPYLVMEFVDGEPIDRYCDGRRLDLTARLNLFQQVCEGVAFAHHTLVLHRDLKPSNILVTPSGHVKVVDFGTATLLQPDRDATISRAPLTPAYASPEQLTGQAVGTASDQYSLGLVLYELLAGRRPFGERASLMASMERALSGAAPPAVHHAVTADAAARRQMPLGRLRRQLAGDLGTIVHKALAPRARDRYASVQHLADDLVRWGDGAPIAAVPPSSLYRATRFVSRHWVATSVAATLTVALVAAAAVSRQQAVIARSESAKAQRLNQFLTEMLASANPIGEAATAARSSSLTVRELLDSASRTVEASLAASPDLQAETRLTLGQTYLGIGVLDQAEAQFEQALALFRRVGPASRTAMALAHLGRSQVLRGRPQAAAPFLREAVALEQARAEDADPAVLTDAMTNLALTITNERPADPEALSLLRESVRIADAHGLATAQVVAMTQALGNQLLIGGALAESEAVLRDGLRRADRLAPDHPTRLYVLRSLSELLRTRGQYEEAARVGEEAATGAAKAWPADYAFQPAFLLTWGRALVMTDDLERARTVIDDAGGRYARLRPAGHPDFATLWLTVDTLHRRQGDLPRAERVLLDARTLLDKYPAVRHTRAHVLGELGLTSRAQGRTQAARDLLAESHGLYRELLGEAHPLTVLARERLDGGDR